MFRFKRFRCKPPSLRNVRPGAIAVCALACLLPVLASPKAGAQISSSSFLIGQWPGRDLLTVRGSSLSPYWFDVDAPSLPRDAPSPPGSAGDPKPALGAVEVGWTTLYADEGASEREEINGPFYRLSFNVPKGFSVFFDSTNYYGRNRNGSLNGHGFTFGLGHGVFPTRHVKPNFFAESGVVRTSNAGSIVDQFAFASGLSFTFPLNRHVQLAITPAEWVFLYPNGDPRNDYNAKVGIAFPFGHR